MNTKVLYHFLSLVVQVHLIFQFPHCFLDEDEDLHTPDFDVFQERVQLEQESDVFHERVLNSNSPRVFSFGSGQLFSTSHDLVDIGQFFEVFPPDINLALHFLLLDRLFKNSLLRPPDEVNKRVNDETEVNLHFGFALSEGVPPLS